MKLPEHSISFLKIANDHFTNSQHVITWIYSTWTICFLNNTRVQKKYLDVTLSEQIWHVYQNDIK